MKHFFTKTLLLMIALFLCVMYGMEVAKHNMMTMVGQKTEAGAGILSDLKTPLVKPSTSTAQSNQKSSQTSKGQSQSSNEVQKQTASTSTDELQARINKLNTIQTFNPYSSLGERLSSGLQVTFLHGMTATSSLFNHLLQQVF